MTKSEIRMPKETRNPNAEKLRRDSVATSDSGIRISFGFRISDFGFH